MSARLFFAKRAPRVAAIWFIVVALTGLASPFFLGTGALETDTAHLLVGPTLRHPLGTDTLGRDLLMRLLVGTSATMGVGVMAAVVSVSLGAVIGAAGGWFGGRTDRFIIYGMDAFLCFPAYFLILAVVAVLGPDPIHVTWILGLTGWMGTARLVRAEVLSLRERPFVLASQALGASSARIIFRHLLPNAMSQVIVNMALRLSGSILAETALSFLGLGIQPPTPSWGNLLADAKAAVGTGWWLVVFPGAMIFSTVFSLNILGDRLAEVLRGSHVYERPDSR